MSILTPKDMNTKKILLSALLMLMGLTSANAQQKLVGGDISVLPSYEAKNAPYKDKNGVAITDVIDFMKTQGCNAMRVRLFFDPNSGVTHDAVGAFQDLEYIKPLCKRIKDAGLYLLLDFHYSDTWTDPGKHSKPLSWQSLTTAQLVEKMYTYTKETLQALKEAGGTPDGIQVGNELNVGQLWDTGKCTPWDASSSKLKNFIDFINSAIQACREECPQAQVVFHVAMSYQSLGNSNNNNYVRGWADMLQQKGVDYDVFGLSYYPYYHGPLSELETLLTWFETNYPNREVQVVEAGYPNAWYPSDAKYNYTSVYAATEEGQRKFTADLITKLNSHPQVKGLYWWYPEALGNFVDATNWYNMGLWNNTSYRALKALYELKNFLPDPSGIENLTRDASPMGDGSAYYDLQGRKVSTVNGKQSTVNGKPSTVNSKLPKGLYIHQGKKVIVK